MKNLTKLIINNQNTIILIISIICLIVSLVLAFDLGFEYHNFSKYLLLGVVSLWFFNFYFIKLFINKRRSTPWDYDGFPLLCLCSPFTLFCSTVLIRGEELIQYLTGIAGIVLYISLLISIVSEILKDHKNI